MKKTIKNLTLLALLASSAFIGIKAIKYLRRQQLKERQKQAFVNEIPNLDK